VRGTICGDLKGGKGLDNSEIGKGEKGKKKRAGLTARKFGQCYRLWEKNVRPAYNLGKLEGKSEKKSGVSKYRKEHTN